MKKIKNIKDIQIRKMQLRIRQLEQEKNLNKNWNDLKDNFNPEILKERKIPETKSNETLKGLLISSGLNLGAGILSRKLTEIAGRKIETAMQKGVGKIARKLNAGLRKKAERL
jgi:hypothetical protein